VKIASLDELKQSNFKEWFDVMMRPARISNWQNKEPQLQRKSRHQKIGRKNLTRTW